MFIQYFFGGWGFSRFQSVWPTGLPGSWMSLARWLDIFLRLYFSNYLLHKWHRVKVEIRENLEKNNRACSYRSASHRQYDLHSRVEKAICLTCLSSKESITKSACGRIFSNGQLRSFTTQNRKKKKENTTYHCQKLNHKKTLTSSLTLSEILFSSLLSASLCWPASFTQITSTYPARTILLASRKESKEILLPFY